MSRYLVFDGRRTLGGGGSTEIYLWLVAGLKVTGQNKLKTLMKSDFVIKSKHAYKMNKL